MYLVILKITMKPRKRQSQRQKPQQLDHRRFTPQCSQSISRQRHTVSALLLCYFETDQTITPENTKTPEPV